MLLERLSDILKSPFRLFLSAIICITFSGISLGQIEELEFLDEHGYRGLPYKAPTPWLAPGATTLYFAEQVQQLVDEQNLLLVNVSPITLSPPGIDGKRQWIPRRNKPMENIPGSIWLPNVGYQTLDEEITNYYRNNLEHFTNNNKSRAVLFYCTSDCWMSWNAVKRATEEFGYTNVYWYPYGIDGWKEQDLPLEQAIPHPLN